MMSRLLKEGIHRMLGQTVYLIVEDCDTHRTLAAIRKHCLVVSTAKLEFARAELIQAAMDGHTNVGIVAVDGTILERAYAWDLVRGMYYVHPVAAGNRVVVADATTGETTLWVDNKFGLKTEVPSYLLFTSEIPEFHTDEYFAKLATVHA